MSHYTETVRKWATDTRRAGCLADADGIGEVGLESSQAGSRLAVRFTLKMDLGRIADARYQVYGCGFSMAACAVAADLAIGYTLEDVRKIDSICVDKALDGLPPDRGYCADLAVNALQAAATSICDGSSAVMTKLTHQSEHGAQVSVDDPVYAMLMRTPQPMHVSFEDRHLFACLIAVASQESNEPGLMLGLEEADVESLIALFFPGVSKDDLSLGSDTDKTTPPQCSQDVLSILLQHVLTDVGFNRLLVSVWFAQIVATRAVLPGHLWVAMGLTERPQLSAAIRRHLPSLAEANHMNMRWKRFLYKQVCDLNGGGMCKAPNCGVCSDYSICFVDEDE